MAMCGSLDGQQVLALPVGLPSDLMDDILTATEAALQRHGVGRIWLDTSQHGVVVMADLPATDRVSMPESPPSELPAQP